MNFNSNGVCFVCGKRRSGKSYLVKKLLWLKLKRVIMYDLKWEHSDLLNMGAYRAYTLEQVKSLIVSGCDKVWYTPTDPSIDNFNELCKFIFFECNITLIVDEAASVCTVNVIPYYYSEIVRLGTVRGIGTINVSQRPRFVNNILISESDIVVSFVLKLFSDREKIAGVVGEEAYQLHPKKLPKYHFLMADDDNVVWCKPV